MTKKGNKMEPLNSMYIMTYQIGDEVKTILYWTKDEAIVALYTLWFNNTRGISGQDARDTWNTLIETNGIPEFGDITIGELADYTED